MNLDLKDRKILYELDTNSRQSYHNIAKKVGLSKDSVIYRVNKFFEAGLIQQFHTVLDVGKLGFISFRLYLKLQNTTPEKEEEMIEFLKKQSNIVWLASSEGEYDCSMAVLAKSTHEMNLLWKELLKRYLNFIEKRRLTIFTKVAYFPRLYILNKKSCMDEFVFMTEANKIDLDENDIQILKFLAPNARRNIVELAGKLKLSSKTIASKIKELERKKVIIGYRTVLDISKLGYTNFKVHVSLNNIDEKKERQFRNLIMSHPNIVYDNEVLGGDDIEIDVEARSLDELRFVMDGIKKDFGSIIKNYTYFIHHKEHKYVFFPL